MPQVNRGVGNRIAAIRLVAYLAISAKEVNRYSKKERFSAIITRFCHLYRRETN